MGAQPVQRFFESQRMRLSYWDWGNPGAPPLLFVHGGSDEARSWDRIIEGLREDYHVLALDMRGHGDSDWSPGSQYAIPDMVLDVVRLAEIAGPPARVVGHSFGASTSLIAAGTFPELFAGVVAIEGTHSMNPPALIEEGMGPRWLRTWADNVRDLEERERQPQVYASRDDLARRLAGRNPRQPAEWIAHLAEHGARAVDGGYVWKFDPWQRMRTSMEIRASELERFWAAITCPVLLLFGSTSASARARQRYDAARLFPNARGVVIEQAGHAIQHDQPARTIEEIRTFLRGL